MYQGGGGGGVVRVGVFCGKENLGGGGGGDRLQIGIGHTVLKNCGVRGEGVSGYASYKNGIA